MRTVVLVALLLVWHGLAFGQSASDLTYAGGVKIPGGLVQYANSGLAVAVDPATGLVYVSNHADRVTVFRVPDTLDPAAAPGSVVGDLVTISPSLDPTAQNVIGGMFIDGNDLVYGVYTLYSPGGSPNLAFWRVDKTDFSNKRGPFTYGDADWTAGGFAAIPDGWQTALGGDILATLCCTSTISRTSYGPSATVGTRADVATINRSAADLTRVLGYPAAHPTLGDWNSDGTLWNNASGKLALAFIGDHVWFFGRYGSDYCYGEASACGDPTSRSKGDHAYPYEYHAWVYKASDLAAVKAGQLQPHQVLPTVFDLTLPFPTPARKIMGGAFDAASGRLYLTEEHGGGHLLRVFTVNAAPPPIPDPVPCHVIGYGDPYPINATQQQRDAICADGTPAHGGAPGAPIVEPIPSPYQAEIAAIDAAELALTDALVAFAGASVVDLSSKWAEVMAAQVTHRDAVRALIVRIGG